jgi:hypothetical protein
MRRQQEGLLSAWEQAGQDRKDMYACSVTPDGTERTDAAWRTVEGMATTVEVLSLPVTIEGSDVLRRAVAGYLARYRGLSRSHVVSDLRVFLRWCTQRDLEPWSDTVEGLNRRTSCIQRM